MATWGAKHRCIAKVHLILLFSGYYTLIFEGHARLGAVQFESQVFEPAAHFHSFQE